MKPQKKINWLILSIVLFPILAIGSYLWGTGMINSLTAYRSPLANRPPAPLGTTTRLPLSHKVVIVLVDGLRYDTSNAPDVMPFLDQLKINAGIGKMVSRPPSFSAPGWATILTGAWPDVNDSQIFNPPDIYTVRPFSQDDIFAAADRAGKRTALAGYSWFESMLGNSGVDAITITTGEDQEADQEIMDAALPWLTEDYQLILIHLDQIDYAGHHEGGPVSSNWNEAAQRVDAHLRTIAEEMDFQKETLLIISDHGHIGIGGHGGEEEITLTEPFLIMGAGIIPGVINEIQMTDVAPTISILLGIEVPASNQGRPLYEILDLTPDSVAVISAEIMRQQIQLYSIYTHEIGQPAEDLEGLKTVSEVQVLFEQARMRRLGSERVWRNMVALFFIVMPAYILFLRRQKQVLWYIAGGILYISIFFARYLLLDHKTFGVSSITGQMDFILYTAATTIIALVPAWIIAMIGLHAFKFPRRQAVVMSMQSTWIIIYLLGLPILLNFSVNGVFSSWTLPQFTVQYLGLLSLVQVIFVAVFGLLLAGLIAFFTRLNPSSAPIVSTRN